MTQPNPASADPLAAGQLRQGLDRQRLVTLMSVDLVESTPLTEQLEEFDPELLRDVMLAYHDVCDQAVRRYGGHIPSRAGDGFMAQFGLPDPHEDEASRATRAGLAILDALDPLTDRLAELGGAELRVRIGIHTGPVIITEIGGETEIIGTTPNETARIESVATPGTIAVSGATHQLIADEFTFDEPRQVTLRGVTSPMTVYTVGGVAASVGPTRAVIPFTGRRLARSQLVAAWEEVRDGSDQRVATTAFLRGDPGTGKSRLADFVVNLASRDGADHVVLSCRTFDSAVPFGPVGEALTRAFDLDGRDDDERYQALVAGLERDGAADGAPYLAQILDLGTSRLGEAAGTEPGLLHGAIVADVIGWFRARAANRPLVVVAEDLHWSDASTATLIDRLVNEPIPGLLVIATARPGFEPSWPPERYLPVELGPLSDREVAELVSMLDLDPPLTDEQVEQLIERSDGVPLYLDHLIDLARRGLHLADSPIPSGLDQLLTSVLEVPGVDQAQVGVLATLSRTFSSDLAADVVGEDEASTIARLEDLCERGILERVPGAVRPTYGFRHAQLQAAAYQHQLISDRRIAHGLVAAAIERRGDEAIVDRAAMAHHLDMSGRTAEAVSSYGAASTAAYEKGAMTEAMRLVDRGLELIEDLEPGDQRDGAEAELRLHRSLYLTATEGFGSQAAIDASERALELSGAIVGPETFLRVMIDLFSGATVRGDRDKASEILARARAGLDPDHAGQVAIDQLEALHLNITGSLRPSHERYLTVVDRLERHERGRAEGDPADQPETPTDGLAAAYTQLAPLSWLRGDATASAQWLERAKLRVTTLEGAQGAFTDAYVRSWECWLQLQAGEPEAARRSAQEMIELCGRKGLQMWGGFAAVYETIAAATTSPSEESEGLLGVVIEMMGGMRITTMASYFMTHHGRLAQALGRPDEAVDRLRAAIAMARSTAELQDLSETYRYLGRARLAAGQPAEEAIEDVVAASTIALDQGSTIYAVRALHDLITQFDPALRPSSATTELADQVGLVATPEQYPEVVAAQQILTTRSTGPT